MTNDKNVPFIHSLLAKLRHSHLTSWLSFLSRKSGNIKPSNLDIVKSHTMVWEHYIEKIMLEYDDIIKSLGNNNPHDHRTNKGQDNSE